MGGSPIAGIAIGRIGNPESVGGGAGGAGGWFYRDRSPDMRPPPPAPAPVAKPSTSTPPWPSAVAVVDAMPPAACDDSQGTPEQCPSVGPADEGICNNIIYKRCNEFKTAFKPKVATQAVACLRALKGYERCDPLRINQCGHMALMAACLICSGVSKSGSPAPRPTMSLPAARMAAALAVTAKVGEGLIDCTRSESLMFIVSS